MRANEIITEAKKKAIKQRLDAKCWKGKHKEGTKIKGGVRVNNCVPNESINEYGDTAKGQKMLTKVQKRAVDRVTSKKADTDPAYAKKNKDTADRAWDRMSDKDVSEDWNKVNKQDKTDGLSKKAVKAYRRENPGSKLQTAVTTKPSKLKPGSKAAKRRKSFCARMSGNKGPMKDEKGRPTPKAKALARWNCESVEDLEQMLEEAKKDPCWKGYKQIGMKKKGSKQVPNCVPTNEAALGTAPKRPARPGSRPDRGHAAEPRYKKAEEKTVCEFCGSSDHTALDEAGKASRSLCVSSKPDNELGASQLSSCKAQGLRARSGEKSHKIGKSRVKVGGHRIKGKKYGGPLPDWS